MSRRVVITGLGPVTPIGIGADAFHAAQLEGLSGVRSITRFDASEMTVRFAGEVDFDPSLWIEARELKRIDRYAQLALAAAALALEHAGLERELLSAATGDDVLHTCVPQRDVIMDGATDANACGRVEYQRVGGRQQQRGDGYRIGDRCDQQPAFADGVTESHGDRRHTDTHHTAPTISARQLRHAARCACTRVG